MKNLISFLLVLVLVFSFGCAAGKDKETTVYVPQTSDDDNDSSPSDDDNDDASPADDDASPNDDDDDNDASPTDDDDETYGPFDVYPNNSYWTPSGIPVFAGDVIQINASGTIQASIGDVKYEYTGVGHGICIDCPDGDAPFGALIYRIGDTIKPVPSPQTLISVENSGGVEFIVNFPDDMRAVSVGHFDVEFTLFN